MDEITKRLDSLESRIEAQEEIITQQQETITEQAHAIEAARHTKRSGLSAPVSRRSVLAAGGALALLGSGVGSASAANPSGQVGTADRPLEALYTQSMSGPITGGDTLDTISGDGLDIVDGELSTTGSNGSSNWIEADELLHPSDADIDGLRFEDTFRLEAIGEETDTEEFGTIIGSGNVIMGNPHNTVEDANGATIAGGGLHGDELADENVIYSNFATISGGSANEAGDEEWEDSEPTYQTISGGYNNVAPGNLSVIGGGAENETTGAQSSIAGGINNEASGRFATISGGYFNIASAEGATVSGGGATIEAEDRGNIASGKSSTVSGGIDNSAEGDQSTVNGGENNESSDTWATVGGGVENLSDDVGATVGGGENNEAGGQNSTVGGGEENKALGHRSTVSGGQENKASGEHSTVSGGISNEASAQKATVSGGALNEATAERSTVGGGRLNEASGQSATVSGGRSNKASGGHSTVNGGYSNEASDEGATVLGGSFNTASGEHSFAIGYRATAENDGSFVFADSSNEEISSVDDDTAHFQMPVHAPEFHGELKDDSARAIKTNIASIEPSTILERVRSLEISEWEYTHRESGRHIGPMAGEFYELFGLGSDDGTIGTVDRDGVALAAIQGLANKVEQRNEDIKRLTEENTSLRDRISVLEQVVDEDGDVFHG